MIVPTVDITDEELKQKVKELENINDKLSSALTSAEQLIDKAIEINNRIIEEYKLNYGNEPSKLLCALEIQNKTLQGKEVKNND